MRRQTWISAITVALSALAGFASPAFGQAAPPTPPSAFAMQDRAPMLVLQAV